MAERIEQASVADYKQRVISEARVIIAEANRPPWPGYFTEATVGGKRVLVPDDPLEPEDIIAVHKTAYASGYAKCQQQYTAVAIACVVAGFILGLFA